MNNEIIDFHSSLRQIFGVCPNCYEIFRLSDCRIYEKKRPAHDWKEKIDNELAKLDEIEKELNEKIESSRESARKIGRGEADEIIKKIDTIFSPNQLNPNDAKVIFHPIDFVVFDGMNNSNRDESINKIVLLDKGGKRNENLRTQESIISVIEKQNYEWMTLRIEENGRIFEE